MRDLWKNKHNTIKEASFIDIYDSRNTTQIQILR